MCAQKKQINFRCCLSRHGTSSICPLIKAPLNYPRLQVMAKEIPEEPEEEAMVVDVDEDNVQTSEGPINHPSGELVMDLIAHPLWVLIN